MSRSEITDKGGSGIQPPQPKFKVGDKVRLIHNTNFTTCFKVGDNLEVIESSGGGNYRCINREYRTTVIQIVSEHQIELVAEVSPKSGWFGFKYKVTPETSKLLQEAVFKDGGEWLSGTTEVKELGRTVLFVKQDGKICLDTFDMPEKQPPQPKKDFVVGKWYRCVEPSESNSLERNKYYELLNASAVSEGLRFAGKVDGCYWSKSRFDINSELDYDPNTAHGKFVGDLKAAFPPFEKSVDTGAKEGKIDVVATGFTELPREEYFTYFLSSSETNNFKPNYFSITKEEVNMSNQNRVVSVKFFDDDAGLKAEQSLVAEYQITTRVSDAMTVSKVLLTEDVAGDIAAHNEVRAATVDLHILKQTGNKVTLQPIEFEDLRVEVRQV